jgi:EmrB/QacA subfamily drug resistance transporter
MSSFGTTSKETNSHWLLASLVALVGVFMAFLDSNAVNVAITSMMNDFNTTAAGIEWVTTSYLLTAAIVLPLSGWLNAKFGSKTLYLWCLGIFTFGSVLCGLAWNLETLTLARILQAVGGGMLMSTVMSMVFRLIPKDKMGLGMGIVGIAMMVAPAIAPTLGGVLVEYASWRWIFWINLPVGVLGLIGGASVLPNFQDHKTAIKFDWLGAILSAVSFGALLYSLSKANEWGWTSRVTWLALAGSLAVLAVLIAYQLKATNPLLDLSVFRDRNFTLTMGILVIANLGIVSGLFYIPIFVQTIQGHSALDTGLLLLPSALVSAIFMPISGRLYDKAGAKAVLTIGILLLALTTWLLSGITGDTDLLTLNIWLVVRGIAMGMMPFQAAALENLATPQVPQATAILQIVRNLSGAFGIAFMTALMTTLIGTYGNGVEKNTQAFVHSLQDVFRWTIPLIVLALVPVFLMKSKKDTKNT